MNNYTSLQYWQNRYLRNNELFDWYQRFYSFKEHIHTNIEIKKNSSILILGCGTSRLGQQLLSQGYSKIYNIDFSNNCIRKMIERVKQSNNNNSDDKGIEKSKHNTKKNINVADRNQNQNQKIIYEHMDAKYLSYEDQTFDGVIDKAMLDSLSCAENPIESTKKVISQAYRVLKSKGTYILISYEPPAQKMVFLTYSGYKWKIKVEKILKQRRVFQQNQGNQGEDWMNYHYIYVCTKQ